MNKSSYEQDLRHIVIVTVGRKLLFANYGSFLQHYAMREVLKMKGYAVSRLPDVFTERWPRFPFIYTVIHDHIWLSILALVGKLGTMTLKEHVSGLCPIYKELKFRLDFRKWVAREIEAIPPGRVIALSGSDQVWWSSYGPSFLETFDSSCPRLSYAASSDWVRVSRNAEWIDTVRRELPKFTGVSVREQAGVRLIRSLVPECRAEHVIDPVMLAGRDVIFKIASHKRYFKKPTMLAYFVNIEHSGVVGLENLVALSRMLDVDLKVVDMSGVRKLCDRKFIICPSPSQFVRAIADAEYIVTNSFHGTVLSLLFEKPFLSISQIESPEFDQNCRQRELLELVSLQERRIAWRDSQTMIKAMRKPINWDEVRLAIGRARESSAKWLSDRLDEVRCAR